MSCISGVFIYFINLSWIFLFLTAGFLLKRSAKKNGWSRRWFVLNEKSGKVGNVLFPPIKSVTSLLELIF